MDFVKRSGASLTLDGNAWYFTGFNLPNYAFDYPGWTSLIDIAASGANVVRCQPGWFQTQCVVGGVLDFTKMDSFVAEAASLGLRLILPLTNVGDEALDLTWWQGGYTTQVASGHVVTYQSWVQTVVARYATNPAVMMWQLVNEAQVSGTTTETQAYNAMSAFATAMGSIVKGLAPNQLLSLGNCLGYNGTGGGNQWVGSQTYYLPPTSPVVTSGDYQLLLENTYLDVGDFHDYGYPYSPTGLNNGSVLQLNGALAIGAAVNKPIMVAEMGIDWTATPVYNPAISPNTIAARAPLLRDKMNAMLQAGVAGTLIYSWRDSPASGDGSVYGLEVGPSDPVLSYMPVKAYVSTARVFGTTTHYRISVTSITTSNLPAPIIGAVLIGA